MKILIDNRHDTFEVYESLEDDLNQALEVILTEEGLGLNFEVSFSLVNDEEIQRLNRDFRNVDSVTDVLSFPLFTREDLEFFANEDVESDIMLGDVIISVDRAEIQAKEFLHSLRREIVYLSVHSFFHLLGYDHMNENDKLIMRKKEKNVMKKLKIFKNSDYFYEKYRIKKDPERLKHLDKNDDDENDDDDDQKDSNDKQVISKSEYELLKMENRRLKKIVIDSKREEYSDLDMALNVGEYSDVQQGPKNKQFGDSLNHAIDGVIFALKNETNIKFDFLVTTIVLVASLFFNFTKVEMAILAITLVLVITAELFNTAMENAVDMISDLKYNKLAKIAKDVSAGAVVITAIGAVFVGYLLFYDKLFNIAGSVFSVVNKSNSHKLVIAIGIVLVLVVVLKAIFYRGRGTPLKGGSVSGHAALGFCLATIGSFVAKNQFITLLFYTLAVLIAQSRIESRIHSIYEVIVGGLIGLFIAFTIFSMF